MPVNGMSSSVAGVENRRIDFVNNNSESKAEPTPVEHSNIFDKEGEPRNSKEESEEDVIEDEEEDDDESEDWETSSFIEEIFDDDVRLDALPGDDVCTKEEAASYRARLHEVGADQFILETISSGNVTAKKLCSAFIPNFALLNFLGASPDHVYYEILGKGISRELNKRQKLSQYNTINDAAELLRKSRNILVITGAGISTNLGIPDFRSKHTGFYSKLQAAGIEEPEEVFQIETFDHDPSLFYSLAGDILPEIGKTSPTHAFIRLLQEKGKLRTNYTQNIDNVESYAGISQDKLIQCHGSWATATCRKCGFKVPGREIYEDVKKQRVATCKRCEINIAESQAESIKRKRMSYSAPKSKRQKNFDFDDDEDEDDSRWSIPTPGVMKPDITFFGEKLPDNFFERFKTEDRDVADMVIVIGTSMQVAPVSEIPLVLPKHVPQIYISRDPVRHIAFDIDLLGDCDDICAELARRAGWDLHHPMLPTDSQLEILPFEDQPSKWTVKPKQNSVTLPDLSLPKEISAIGAT